MLNYPLLYVEHLTGSDLELLARVGDVAAAPDRLRSQLVDEPGLIERLLGAPEAHDALFGDARTPLETGVSPFLAFGVLVHRTLCELADVSYVAEWAGPRRRLPVFDVDALRDFAGPGARRYFVIELLASFTRVVSGSTWVRTRRGYRRRRYSELDLIRLAEMVDQHLPAERAAGYRRLGDVALFLAGVFPDHTASHPLSPVERRTLAVSAGLAESRALDDEELLFLEGAGSGWYRKAVDTARESVGWGPDFLVDVADRIRDARRFLNVVADRYLFEFDGGLGHRAV